MTESNSRVDDGPWAHKPAQPIVMNDQGRTHRVRGAYVRYALNYGLFHAVVGGPMHRQTFYDMREIAREHMEGARCGVIDVRPMQPLWWDGWMTETRPRNPAHRIRAAMLVRPETLDLWLAYARAMARVGIRRLIYTDMDDAMAWSWEFLDDQNF